MAAYLGFKIFVLLLLACLVSSQSISNTYYYDAYPWTPCNTFEATKKNCPRGEACLKLKKFKDYNWYHNWAMKCKSQSFFFFNTLGLNLFFSLLGQSREEFLAAVEYIYGL